MLTIDYRGREAIVRQLVKYPRAQLEEILKTCDPEVAARVRAYVAHRRGAPPRPVSELATHRGYTPPGRAF